MKALLFLLAGIACLPVYAQKKNPARTTPTEIRYDSFFAAVKWRNIGPFRGGRANAICGVPHSDNSYYVGYAGGGVWKTQDAGESWYNISDGFFTVGSIGDIAVAESDPNVVVVGSGEHAVRGVMTSYGDGVYKSTDAGRTWKNIGLTQTRHIADVVIHPANPDIMWVAAQGTVHGPNPDRGIYKTSDGGSTWKKVLFINDSTGISSLSLDKTNPRILYAASWTHQRYPWTVSSGGTGSGLWRSVDGGETWKKINTGLPLQLGKIGISVSPANPSRVYAIVEAEKTQSGLYRSDDRGEHWNLLSSDQDICSRSWYYMEVQADPNNENTVYVMNAPLMRSIDGGRTFSKLKIEHGDTHDLWINPSNSNNIALADDGGASVSFNFGSTWSTLNNQPTGQFYRVNTDNLFPYKIYGGQQDNTSVIISSRNNGSWITERDWSYGPGCESAYLAFDPENPAKVMGGCYQGYIEILDKATNEIKDVQAYPQLNLAVPPKQLRYRFNWNAPIVASMHEKGVYYHAGNRVLKTNNDGLAWTSISPDLTRNDTLHQGPGGIPLTNEGAGGENYNTIYYLCESPLEKGTLWSGSDCGLVFLTRDEGANWFNVTPKGLPECMIHSIELSPHDKGTAYICATRYKFNDYASYTYRTTDYGQTWTLITQGLKTDDFIRVIREDKKVKGLLYAGSEHGFYISYDQGSSWQTLQRNLPVVTITDLMIRQNDLVASTAGRGFWILDELAPFQQGSTLFQSSTIKVLTPKPAIRFGNGGELNQPVPGEAWGENTPEGVILDYFLPETSESSALTLEIVDEKGSVLRTFSNQKDSSYKRYPGGPPPVELLPAGKGLHRLLWNFRRDQVRPDVNGVFVYGDYRGARVSPGTYKARLVRGHQKDSAMINLLQEAKLTASPADWEEQQQFLQTLSSRIKEIHATVNRSRTIAKQVTAYLDVLGGVELRRELVKAAQELLKKLQAWEGELVEPRIKNGQDVINWPSKLNVEYFSLKGLADQHDPRLTEGVKQRFQDLEQQWRKLFAQFEGPLQQQIREFNLLYQKEGLPAIIQ